MIRRPPRSPLFPYTTLSRSLKRSRHHAVTSTDTEKGTGLPASSLESLSWTICRANWLGLESLKAIRRSEEHTSELQSQSNLVCRLLLEKKKKKKSKARPVHA